MVAAVMAVATATAAAAAAAVAAGVGGGGERVRGWGEATVVATAATAAARGAALVPMRTSGVGASGVGGEPGELVTSRGGLTAAASWWQRPSRRVSVVD